MKSIKLVLLVVLVFSLGIAAFQNQDLWPVRFLWMTGEMPGIILLFLTAAAGFVAGITVAFLVKKKKKKK